MDMDMNVNFIQVTTEELNGLDLTQTALSGSICYNTDTSQFVLILPDRSSDPPTRIVLKYINAESAKKILNDNNDEVDCLTKTSNLSLILNNNENSIEESVGAIDLNMLPPSEKVGNFAFAAGNGLAIGDGSIALGGLLEDLGNPININPLDDGGISASISETSDDNSTTISETEDETSTTITPEIESSNILYSITKFIISQFSSNEDLNLIERNMIVKLTKGTKSMLNYVEIINKENRRIEFGIKIPEGWITKDDNTITMRLQKLSPATANAKSSISLGYGVSTKQIGEIVLGQYNSPVPQSGQIPDRVLTIGTGQSVTNQRNSVEIFKNGKIFFNGPNKNTVLSIESDSNNNDCVSVDFQKIGKFDESKNFTSLEEYIDLKIDNSINGAEGTESSNIYQILITPPTPQELNTNNKCLWLDTSIGNGILKRPVYENSQWVWKPISSAYT